MESNSVCNHTRFRLSGLDDARVGSSHDALDLLLFFLFYSTVILQTFHIMSIIKLDGICRGIHSNIIQLNLPSECRLLICCW